MNFNSGISDFSVKLFWLTEKCFSFDVIFSVYAHNALASMLISSWPSFRSGFETDTLNLLSFQIRPLRGGDVMRLTDDASRGRRMRARGAVVVDVACRVHVPYIVRGATTARAKADKLCAVVVRY